MSREDFKGSAWAFQQLMELAKAEIDCGDKQGATVLWAKAATPLERVRMTVRRKLSAKIFTMRKHA